MIVHIARNISPRETIIGQTFPVRTKKCQAKHQMFAGHFVQSAISVKPGTKIYVLVENYSNEVVHYAETYLTTSSM